MIENCHNILLRILFGFAISIIIWSTIQFLARKCKKPSAATALALIIPVVLFILCIASFARDLPFFDDFDAILAYLSQPVSSRVTHLFDFHNEHRIFTSRLIFEIIYGCLGRFDFRICIWIGDIILLFYMFLLGRHVSRAAEVACFLPFLWLFLDLSNYENTLWAMTSVSNQLVLPLALISLLFFNRRSQPRFFIAALLFAIACTYTTGAGIFIWPVLVAIAIKDWFMTNDRWHAHNTAILSGIGKAIRHPATLAFLFVAISSIVCYMNGFHEQSLKLQSTLKFPSVQSNPAITIPCFVFAFCGAIVPVLPIAIAVGIIVCSMIIYIAINIRKVHDNVTLGLLLFTLGSVLSGALFRYKFGPGQALQLRYGIVSFSLMSCTTCLFAQLLTDKTRKLWRITLNLMLLGAILINLTTLSLGWELMTYRTRQLELGLTAPDSPEADSSRPEVFGAKAAGDKIEKAIQMNVWQRPTVN